jgi:hypothetical protein
MSEGHRRQDELCAFVEGQLSQAARAEVELHLARCSKCAVFAGGYARFLAQVEAMPVYDPALEAATARLDARMEPYLRGVLATEARATQMLHRAFGIVDLVRTATRKLRDLVRIHPEWGLVDSSAALEPARAWTKDEPAPAESWIDNVVVQDARGTETTTRARLAYLPDWPSERVDLLLELDLRFRGWEAAVGYVLDVEPAEPSPAALLLYEGPVDAEGLIEIQSRWEGPVPPAFEASRLRICLSAEASGRLQFEAPRTEGQHSDERR